MKKFISIIFATTILSLGLTACSSKLNTENQKSAYQRVNEMLTELESYRCSATVEYISNKNKNTYNTFQCCKSSGEYRVEITEPETVSGNITLFDGTTIYQFNPKIQGKVSVSYKETMDRSEIFLTSFIKNYARSMETAVSVANIGEGKCTLLEATIPGEHPYLSTEKLWVDNETLKPIKLSVCDKDGSERIIVTYSDFEYNVELEDDLFKI